MPLTATDAFTTYTYQATATDADNDPLTYTLLEGPTSMTVGSTTGLVTWSNGTEDEGTHPVELQVSDGRGGFDQQSYTLTVNPLGEQLPPYFTSTPVITAIVGSPYSYQAVAVDPSGALLSYAATSHPDGLAITDTWTGLVTWTPTPDEIGTDFVTLEATNPSTGLSATQTYEVVVTTPPNDAVYITSTPVTFATANNSYEYDVTAISSLSLPLTYSLTTYPPDMTINQATGAIYWAPTSANDGDNTVTVLAQDTGGASDTQTYTLDVEDTNTLDGQKYTVLPTPAPTPTSPDAGAPANYIPPIDLVPISAPLPNPNAVVYNAPTNSLIASINFAGGYPETFEQIFGNATTGSFTNVSDFSNEIQMATAEPGVATGFQVGDIYTGNGQPGQIVKITDAGATVINPWVTLPGESGTLRGNLWIDNTGAWGGDLIAATTSGDIWLVTPDGDATEIATPGGYLEGMTTVPNDPAVYGPLAGTILAANEDSGGTDALDAVDSSGQVTQYSLGFGDVESVAVIPANENFYGVDFQQQLLLGVSASYFTGLAGDILVEQENMASGTSGLYVLHWNGSQLQTVPILLAAGSSQPKQWEDGYFTPFGVTPLATTQPTIGLPNWTINLENSSGTVIASTTTDAQGNYSFTNVPAGTYTVAEVPEDGWTQFAPTTGTYTVTVTSDEVVSGLDFGNDETAPEADPGPVFQSSPGDDPTAQVGQLYTYTAMAPDADHDQVTYSLSLKPAGMIIDPTSGVIDWTPSAGEVGFQTVDIVANDGNGNLASQYYTIAVSPADSPPAITTTAPQPAYAGMPYTYQAAAVSPDNYTFSFSPGAGFPTGMSITAAGLLTWPDPTGTTASFTIDVTDSKGGVGTQPVTLTIVPPPGAGEITFTSVPRESVLLGQEYVYQAVAADTDDYTLTYSLPTAGDPDGMSIDPTTGLVTWTPSAVGTSTVTVDVSDEYGDMASQSFPVTCATQESDQPPSITSTAPRYAIVGDLYRYNLTASDPSGGPLLWTLDSPPAGMVLDPSTNSLIWTPTPNQANTTPSVTIEVSDGEGGTAGQTFQIDVLAADLPPVFVNFDPPGQAGAGVAYAYQVQAYSPGGFYPLTYSVTASPTNSDITIDPSSGLLQWPDPSGDGETITVTVSDPAQLSASETYNLTVSSTAPGVPPVFDPPAPPADAAVSYAYSYTPSVTYTAGDDLSFEVSSTPYLSDLGFDDTTGSISWTPTTDDYDVQQPISITITAVDNTVGMDAFLTFPVTVTTDTPPSFSSGSPPSTLTAGQTFVYQVQASDPDGDALTYALLGQPAGMSIDSSGRITWPTTASNIGDYSYQVVVTSPAGLSQTSPPYSLDVSADTTPPTVQLEISSNPADVGSVVYFDVIASDNVGVTSIGLTIGGTPVVLGENGQGQYTASTLGEFSVVATASNAAGLSSQSTATLSVIDPTDTSAPTVSIASPTDGAVITSPTEVVGTVSDSDILSWTLAEAPLNGGTFTTIASGTSSVDDADLGLFDPTTLADGAYTLELTAWNAGGHVSTASITVNVSGYLKLGNLDLSFTDLSIPLAGIPITITRTYNSLNADTSSDFGYGWTLSETDYQLSVNTLGNGLGSFDDYVPLEAGNRVVVTLPDGTEEGFTFEPQAVTDPWGLVVEYYTPYFQPDTGVTDTLTVQPAELSEVGSSGEFFGGDGDDYNPAESEFGSDYTLTNESGIATTFNATTGQVLSESDRHGNTLTFDSSGIYSNTGLAVTFDRDSEGRITTITDPDGWHITYTYTASGDLASVTDRDGNVTSFGYSTALPHFLDQITDSMGNVVMSVQYDPDGRITQITNATGSSDSLSYNLSNLSESATAPGNASPTVNTYNTEGLLAKSVDADGNETDYTYVDNFLTSETQVVGGNDLTTNYVNNIYGQPTQETDPAGNTTYYTYDEYGDPQTESDIYGDTTSFSYYYDADNSQDPMNGDLMSTTDPLGSTSEFTYDDAGDVHTTTTDAGTADAATTTNVYNQYGDLMSTTTPQGVTTSNTYDADGNLLTSKWVWVNPNDTSETDAEKTLNSYDGNGNLKGTQTSANGVVQTTTSSLYDADNRVYSSTDELGGVTTTVYDVNGNVIQTTTPDGMVTDSVYNALGQVTYTDDAHLPGMPTDGTLTEYDQDGNVIGTENLANVVITVTMTGLDTGTSVLASPGTILSSTSTKYDAAGRVTETVDASGLITDNTYDKVGNLLTSTETVNGVSRMTSSTYNKIGEVTSTTDALGNTTQYQYNAAGQVTVTTFADGSSITDEYDTQGNKIAEIDQNGLETQYQYNAYGELTEVIEPSMMDLDPNDSTYRQLVTPTYHYGYDNYGDQTSTTDAQGNTTTYAFNSTGNMVSETLPMGGANGTEYWTYNPLGELTEFVDFDGNETDYAYNDLGQVRQKTVYAYSDLMTPYETVGYQYNIYTTGGSYQDVVDDSIDGVTTSTYDVNDNLIELESPQGTIDYDYDQVTGDEIEVSTSNTETYYSYDPAGEMTQVTVTELDGQAQTPPLVTSYSYDADGNLVYTQNANGTTEARKYNDLNELTSIVDSGPWGEYAGFAYTYSSFAATKELVEREWWLAA